MAAGKDKTGGSDVSPAAARLAADGTTPANEAASSAKQAMPPANEATSTAKDATSPGKTSRLNARQREGNVGQALRSVYQQTINEDVPEEMLKLLGKLT